jgi:hypothetical protein
VERFCRGASLSQADEAVVGLAKPFRFATLAGALRGLSTKDKSVHLEPGAMKKFLLGATLALVALAAAGLCWAWWDKGHASIAEAAVGALPTTVPPFFRAAKKQLGHLAGEPDRWKNPSCKFLRAAEAPDHFIDLEDFGDKELPAHRYEAIALLQTLKRRPERVGMLPYAIMENFDRLSCAFYDYRADKDSPAIRARCLVYAGVLAHYTSDCAMPLHTTRDYDGRPDKEGKVRQKGIHAKIDAFPGRHGLSAEEIGRGLEARKIDDVWAHVLEQARESHKLVGRCYELDKAGAFDKPTPQSRRFILMRCRVAARFTADLWYTAWVRSARMPKHY